MKKIISATAVLALFLTACQNFVKNEDESTDSLYAKEDVVARDMSITAENAYSDLFLDSTAVDSFISREKLAGAEAQQLRNFYNGRNFQFAWFTSQGLTEQGRGFWNLYKNGSTDSTDNKGKNNNSKSGDDLVQQMDSLVAKDSLNLVASDTAFAGAELALTHKFIQYVQQNGNGASFAAFRQFIPAKKMSVTDLADSILNRQKDSSHLSNKAYAGLKQQLSKYQEVARKGGWQPISLSGQVAKGSSSPAISAIKKRLRLTGDYAGNDTTALYNDSLQAAIRSFQQRHGLQPSGIINDSVVRAMNVPVEQRITQILINMNRMVWTPLPQDSAASVIRVNIPEFMLYVDDRDSGFSMPVVTGKEGTNTMMFSGSLNQVVFSPYWNLPESIVRDEIMPAMKSDPGYLKKRNMEIVKQNDSIPTVRQLPGSDNALGKVKFLFPNSFDIYFHDTPNKELFNKQQRAFSHGCIRLADAARLASYLLQDQKEWTPEKINAAMNSKQEQHVKLNRSVPVVITYYTAWTDQNGQIHFRDDVYGWDQRTASRMFVGMNKG
ncbi:MAG TPA: L,D-transpeptidase family protein [Flavisolibacter sp.]